MNPGTSVCNTELNRTFVVIIFTRIFRVRSAVRLNSNLRTFNTV